MAIWTDFEFLTPRFSIVYSTRTVIDALFVVFIDRPVYLYESHITPYVQPVNKVLLLCFINIVKLVSWLQYCVECRLSDKTPGPLIIFTQSIIA
jgi:hypothetical protein